MLKVRESYRNVKQGAKIGKWEVLGPLFALPQNTKPTNHRWHVVAKCECGHVEVVESRSLDKKISSQCKSCRTVERNITHGESQTQLYGVWQGMRARCSNPRLKCWPDYGGRGIHVCEEWSQGFEVFRDWALTNGYDPGLEIDRIDNDGNYEPGNCRWITRAKNARNKRSNVMLTLNGETKCIAEWAGIIGITPLALYKRKYRGWSDEKALTTPGIPSGG